MDEAKQRFEWQQSAALVCMIYNTACDTRKTGPMTPDMIHALAGSENVGKEERRTPGVSLTKETAKAFRTAWQGKIVEYNPKDF